MATILIVEDDADLAASFLDLLRPLKATLILANDGQQALDLLAALPLQVDLIILDLYMPHVNGWEFLDFRKKSEALMAIPVLVVSAWTEIDLELPYEQLQGLLHKSCAAHQLIGAVQKILGIA